MICSIIGCNAEGNVNLTFYCFYRKDKKPFAKERITVCEIHAKNITADDTSIKIHAVA